MYCESCGSFIPDGQSFCSNCGTPVAKPEQPVVQQAAPAPAPGPAPVPAPVPAPIAAAPVAAAAPAPAPQPVPVQPVYQQPQPVQPVYQQPVYQQPQVVQPVYQQPVYQQPVYQQIAAKPAKPGNSAATAALVFGILTLVFSWLPIFNVATTGIMGLLGLIFSIVGLAKKGAGGKAKAVVGLVLTILGICATVGFYGFFYNVIITDPSLSQEWDEIWEDTSATVGNNSSIDSDDLYIDGDFINTENGYVTGVLHIDGYRVDF